jgi:hypothetical protein
MAAGSQRYAELYCGPDLINAAKQSNMNRSMSDRFAGLLNGLRILADSVRYRRQPDGDSQFEIVVATGMIQGTSTPASIAYAGKGANLGWCFDTTISGRNDIKTARYSSADKTIDALRNVIDEVDIVYVDSLGEDLIRKMPIEFVRIPAWIKQRVPVADNWASQMRSLKRGTRQEISRVLRKYGYECRLTCEAADIFRFYDQQYRPYIHALYGEAAIVVDRNRFVRECRRGMLLQLIQHDEVVATALLRPIGLTMAIVWIGMETGADAERVPGATDALDYFSLLYAHLKGFQWLDFGPSRPDLCDGALRYKGKWGSEITAGHFTQPSIYWTCSGRNAAVQQFLQRHAFVSIQDRELKALFFLDENAGTEAQLSKLEKLVTPGISEYRVVSLSTISKALRADLKRIHLNTIPIEAVSVADAMRVASQVRVTHQ